MPAGRPIEYVPEICERAKEYIDACEDEIKSIISGKSEKFTTYTEKVIVKIPTIEGLSLYLGIHKDTVYDWEVKYSEFSDVISILRAKQAERLINNGLSGDYNPFIAKALLAKHGYHDKVEQQQSGGTKNELKVTIIDSGADIPEKPSGV